MSPATSSSKRKLVIEVEEIEHDFKRIHLTASRSLVTTSVPPNSENASLPLIPYPTLQEQSKLIRGYSRKNEAISTIKTGSLPSLKGQKSPNPPASPSRMAALASAGNNPSSQLLEPIPETEDEPPLDDCRKNDVLDPENNLTRYPSLRPTKLRLKRLHLATSEFTFRSPLPSSAADDFQSWTANYKLNPEHAQLIIYSPSTILTSPPTTELSDNFSKSKAIASAPPILKYSSLPSPTANGQGVSLLQTLEYDNTLELSSLAAADSSVVDSDIQMDSANDLHQSDDMMMEF
jgi:hypothetical protein